MNISRISGVTIDGVYGCIPSQEVDNRDVGADLFGSSIDDLIKSTGIVKRRICPANITGLDLCLRAAQRLIEENKVDPNDIGGIVYVTFTPNNIMPNNSTFVQNALGIAIDIPAFDINLACSGYPYGLWVSSMMAKSLGKKILLLDGDRQSQITSPYDKATSLLFSDAGSATIVSPSDSKDEWQFTFETNGSNRDALLIKDGGAKNFLSDSSLLYNIYEDGSRRRNVDIMMNGLEVFKFVAQNVKSNLAGFMQEMGNDAKGFDYLVLHQANVYMLKQVCKKLGFGLEKLPITADKYGNSSSATIPVTIASELQEAIKEKELSLLISGFGAGLSIGSASIKLNRNTTLGVVEYEC